MKRATVTNNKRYFEGTIGVIVERTMKHPLYKKIIKRHKKYMVQWDAKTPLELGTIVYIEQCAPVSKTKTWKIMENVKNA